MSSIKAALAQSIGLEDYLAWSTVVSALLFIPVMPSIFLGYLVVILNCLILLVFDQLAIHRNHLIALLSIAGFSLIGAHYSGTGINSVVAETVGIAVLSVYYFSALTNFNIGLSQWMEMYIRVALIAAILGLLQWAIARVLHIGDGRLMSIYLEPSHYIFLTLPAVGYCINRYVIERKYGWESLIFVLTYVLADSALGFLGLLLIGIFTFTPRLKGWQMLLGSGLLCVLVSALYVGSANLRLRVDDTIIAIATQDLGGTNASTFAMLSNLYVTSQSFMAHPLTGVGIGGYANAYDTYIGNLSGPGLLYLQDNLNRDDANSLFLRVAAELGLPGLVILFGFIIVCAQVRGQPYLTIRNALLPYMLIRMGRFGAYFSVEVYFFVCLYVLNYMQSRANQRQIRRA